MPHRLPSSLTLAAVLVCLTPAAISATTTTVECGQLSSYTAPDPVAPATGSLTIGLLPAWTIASDATLSPAVQANLVAVAGTGPSCLTVDRDNSDVITGLDFAATGTITGPVIYNGALPGEVFADRILVPTFITDAYPGLAAVFVASRQAGTNAIATFAVDTSNGRFTGVDASASFCGAADLAGNGDGTVGAATIPASVLDPTSTARLSAANGDSACADVDVEATLDGSGNLTVATQVVVTLAAQATPPDTASSPSVAPPSSGTGLPGLVLFASIVVVCAAAGDLKRRRLAP